MNRYSMKALLACVASAAVVSVSGTAMAVPYAAQVVQTGNTVNYVLNEDAASVTVTRDGGSSLVMPVTAGATSFDMTGFSSYSIEVTQSAATDWVESQVSLANPMMEFERANGIAVNRNPGSASFGQFYVSHRADTTTVSGRAMGDGIYVFNADGTDLGGITDPNDTAAARQAGLGTFFASGSSSPYRIDVGEDDALYISDWSDANGGVYVTNADVTTGNILLANPGGTPPIVGQNHGSVTSTPVIKGSLGGGDLQLWTIDEDLEASVIANAQHIWRYDIGSDPGPTGYAGAQILEVDADLTGANGNGLNSDGSRIFFPDIPGVDVDLTYDSVNDNFIVTQRRNDGNESGLVIYNGDFSQMLFNSRQFSLDNGLDGTESDIILDPDGAWDGQQDIFRGSADAVVSPDGSFMVINRSAVGDPLVNGINDFFGSGGALVVPLDANGVPDLDLTDIGLASEDGVQQMIMLGATSIDVTAGNGFRSPISIDLAGNVYYTTNNAEVAQVFSPGGNSTAITASDGTFTINGVTYGGTALVGDLNGDGFVGIDDLNIVLGNWNLNVPPANPLADPSGDGFVGIDDLNQVLGNWNAGTPPTGGAAVPEPTTLALLGLGGVAMLRRRR